MASPLEGAIRRTIGKAMASAFYPAKITRTIPGTGGTPWEPGEPTYVDYSCRAIVDSYSTFYQATGLVQAGDVKIIVLAASIDIEPKPSDSVTIRGKTYFVINVAADPAQATWIIQGRQ